MYVCNSYVNLYTLIVFYLFFVNCVFFLYTILKSCQQLFNIFNFRIVVIVVLGNRTCVFSILAKDSCPQVRLWLIRQGLLVLLSFMIWD